MNDLSGVASVDEHGVATINSGNYESLPAKAAMRYWISIAVEVARDHPFRLPEILGKALWARTRFGIKPHHFFAWDLHNRPQSSWRDYMGFTGAYETGIRTLNSGGEQLSRDKVLLTERLVSKGVPVVPIVAVIGRDRDIHPDGGAYRVVDGVAAIEALLPTWPDQVFVKPAIGTNGEGTLAAGRDGDAWLVNGARLTNAEFAERLMSTSGKDGLLVQPRLTNDSRLKPILAGEALSTVRVIVARTRDGGEPLIAALKVTVGAGITDNFVSGRSGNLIASIDMGSGRITKLYGRGPGRWLMFDTPRENPATGQPIVGFMVPGWRELLELARLASDAVPEIPMAGLDIAIADQGLFIVEMNADWGLAIPQLSGGRGVRRLFRDVWPRLLAPEPDKTLAAEHFQL